MPNCYLLTDFIPGLFVENQINETVALSFVKNFKLYFLILITCRWLTTTIGRIWRRHPLQGWVLWTEASRLPNLVSRKGTDRLRSATGKDVCWVTLFRLSFFIKNHGRFILQMQIFYKNILASMQVTLKCVLLVLFFSKVWLSLVCIWFSQFRFDKYVPLCLYKCREFIQNVPN